MICPVCGCRMVVEDRQIVDCWAVQCEGDEPDVWISTETVYYCECCEHVEEVCEC